MAAFAVPLLLLYAAFAPLLLLLLQLSRRYSLQLQRDPQQKQQLLQMMTLLCFLLVRHYNQQPQQLQQLQQLALVWSVLLLTVARCSVHDEQQQMQHEPQQQQM